MKKADFIWFNGHIMKWDDAKVSVMSHALHYGTSIFEGIRCYKSHLGPVIFRHREHMKRLHDSAKIYRFPLNYTVDELMNACRNIVNKNKFISAYIRPLVFIGDVGLGIYPENGYKTEVVIAAFPWKKYFKCDEYTKGINTIISSWNRFTPNTLPISAKAGGHYLSSLLMADEARRYGCQESIGLNSYGYVAEGSGENLFKIKNDVLLTPPLASSVLPGITRDTIITLAKDLNIEVHEKMLLRESLYIADEVFMCGTAVEIVPVCSIDGIKINSGICGNITKRIQKAFFGLFTGKTKDKWGWLDKVHS